MLGLVVSVALGRGWFLVPRLGAELLYWSLSRLAGSLERLGFNVGSLPLASY